LGNYIWLNAKNAGPEAHLSEIIMFFKKVTQSKVSEGAEFAELGA
jgi:hypothetical protein